MANTDTFEAQILNHIFHGTAIASYTPYLALFSVAPTDSSNGTEVAYPAYARIALDTYLPTATAGSLATNAIITFAQNDGGEQPIRAVGVVTHATDVIGQNGCYIKVYAATNSATLAVNSTPTIQVGALSATED